MNVEFIRRLWPPPLRTISSVLVPALTFALGVWLAAPKSSAHGEGHEHGQPGIAGLWTCSMHPQIKLPEPGNCPICGMALIPLARTEGDALGPAQVTLSARARSLARIRTSPVQRQGSASVELKLLGRFEANETRVSTITPWIGGRIDRLYVSVVGAKIGRGQAIAQVYSPEAYAAQQDLITAQRQVAALAGALPIARRAAESGADAARQRLSLLGIPEETITEMAKEKSPRQHVTIYAQHSGTVLEQLVHEGAYITPGTPLFRVADLNQLWVQMDAYENDLALVSVGQKVTLQVASFPGELFEGKIAFIDPIVDPQTRTAQVRVEVPNPKGRLSPGMFAEAVVHATEGIKREISLVVPRSAPLFTGKRSVVYLELPNKERPTYEARDVQLGPRTGEVYPVVSGLQEGELVVVEGAFVLDSELQIRGGESMMAREDDLKRGAKEPIEVPETFIKGFAPVVAAYLELQKHLSSDNLPEAKKAAKQLAAKAQGFSPLSPAKAKEAWSELLKPIVHHATQASNADSLERLRQVFEPLSGRLIVGVERFGNPLDSDVKLAFCPMAGSGGDGAHWLQRADKVENPYYGAQMYSCGEIQQELSSGEHLSGGRVPAHAASAGGQTP